MKQARIFNKDKRPRYWNRQFGVIVYIGPDDWIGPYPPFLSYYYGDQAATHS